LEPRKKAYKQRQSGRARENAGRLPFVDFPRQEAHQTVTKGALSEIRNKKQDSGRESDKKKGGKDNRPRPPGSQKRRGRDADQNNRKLKERSSNKGTRPMESSPNGEGAECRRIKNAGARTGGTTDPKRKKHVGKNLCIKRKRKTL